MAIADLSFREELPPVVAREFDALVTRLRATEFVVGNLFFHEVPAGTVDGANTVFTTSSTFTEGQTMLYVNGLRQLLDVDYTETSPNILTLTTAPVAGDLLSVDYF